MAKLKKFNTPLSCYNYNAVITNVVDGDTFDFEIDLGFGITYSNRLRLYGVNTPEVRGKEKVEGLKVKRKVKRMIENKQVTLHTRKWQGKFGRYIASVTIGNDPLKDDLAEILVSKGMAKRVYY